MNSFDKALRLNYRYRRANSVYTDKLTLIANTVVDWAVHAF